MGILTKLKSLISRFMIHHGRPEGDVKDGIVEKKYESEEEININFIGGKKPIIHIGLGTYINGLDLYCWESRIKIDIGRYCSIADKITIIAGGEHDMHWVSTYPFIPRWKIEKLYSMQRPRFKGDIKIGNDVWIGNNVIVLSGVTIGDGAVIGAGSIVTKNVPPYCIAAGNPAQVIKKRFKEEIIEGLLKISWWTWDKNKIMENLPLFDDVKEFVEKHNN